MRRPWGTEVLVGVSRIAEKGVGLRCCWKSDVFPTWETETFIRVWHTPCPAKAPWGGPVPGARAVLTREPNEIFLGLQDAEPTPQRGYGSGQCPALRLLPPGRAGRIWTFRSIFNFARTRSWGRRREILLPPRPRGLSPGSAPSLV